MSWSKTQACFCEWTQFHVAQPPTSPLFYPHVVPVCQSISETDWVVYERLMQMLWN